MATINNNSTSLESIFLTGMSCEFAGDIHSPNDVWHILKESRDVDLESFTAHMLNIDNNGQLHQQLLLADAEPANVDPCHRSLILKFVHLLDGAGYSVKKMSDTKTSVHTG
ncbi:unnamed protein product [Adineta steineri]|uniref:Uncharacterized protein n=1 Tax=Adineta steineri TaxID=433720 RepID=A0A819XNT9_9BILA|nr:unnamed protein product [Adineta steineri]CAF4143573.1 unnamed protein product [Adineta steineri]